MHQSIAVTLLIPRKAEILFVLAFFVIVGLVAVVRVLRRTDDIVSILLAVVVGGFVTLGPLAFMLSTT